jgi:hypothetical protein
MLLAKEPLKGTRPMKLREAAKLLRNEERDDGKISNGEL